MEPCDKPLAEMALCEAGSCIWDKGAKALSAVFHTPGSASITDWALTVLVALVLLNFLILLIKSLMPRRVVEP